jgi:hypothetical protein
MNAMKDSHTDFSRAFTDGAQFLDPTDDPPKIRTVQLVHVGELTLESGKLILVDTGVFGASAFLNSFSRQLAPGRFHADLSIASMSEPLVDRAVAAARLKRHGGEAPVRWERAHPDVTAAEGVVALFDATALSAHETGPDLVESIDAAMGSVRSCLFPLPRGALALLVRHRGPATAWWGVDEKGETSELTIDLGVLMREAWLDEQHASVDSLHRSGEVSLAGSRVRIVPPDEVPGPWTKAFWHELAKSMPPEIAESRPELVHRPDIALALWIERPDCQVTLMDERGRRVFGKRSNTIWLEHGEGRIEWWAGIDTAVTLRLRRLEGKRTPMGPPTPSEPERQ